MLVRLYSRAEILFDTDAIQYQFSEMCRVC